jgi:hypothetical protein
MSVTLDAGALVALERNERSLWAALKLAAVQDEDVMVPSTVLAQVWRGTPTQARLAAALKHCVVAPFDPSAQAVGRLCGLARTHDIVDAHVAIVAAGSAALYTSDPADMKRLLAAHRGKAPRIVRC